MNEGMSFMGFLEFVFIQHGPALLLIGTVVVLLLLVRLFWDVGQPK